MSSPSLDIVILGLSITSSWGNGHATTYRGLVRELEARGHKVLFLERDVPWYAAQRDLPDPPFGRTQLYQNLDDLQTRFAREVRGADAVIVGSYVPDGVAVAEWVLQTAHSAVFFYDIDTPVTLAKLDAGDEEYLNADLIPRFDAYLSFSGGPILGRLQTQFGAQRALPFYCSFDPAAYFPAATTPRWNLGYLGTYSDDRQPPLEKLLCEPARLWHEGQFCVAGPQYPREIAWPKNVERIEHLPPAQHRDWYCAQNWTLNITRAAMIAAGFSPSVRLFEAAACGTPIISDYWDGLDTFFEPNHEIIIAHTPDDVLRALREIPDEERRAIGQRARAKVLGAHTAAHRVQELESYLAEVVAAR